MYYIGWLENASIVKCESLEQCRGEMDREIPAIIDRHNAAGITKPLKLRITKGHNQKLVYEWTIEY